MKLDIVSILQVGLSGFSFFLAYFTYKILLKEQSKENPNLLILKSAKNYFMLCILLAVLVGSFRIVEIKLSKTEVDIEEISRCHDNLELLRSRCERYEDIDQLRSAIIEYESSCSELMIRLEKTYQK